MILLLGVQSLHRIADAIIARNLLIKHSRGATVVDVIMRQSTTECWSIEHCTVPIMTAIRIYERCVMLVTENADTDKLTCPIASQATPPSSATE